MATTSELRDFRRSMRRFERLTNALVRDCCHVATLAQCLVLLESDEAGRPLTVSQLAGRLRLDSSTLSRSIDGLVKLTLLDRRRDEADRRVVRVGLTESGRRACRAIHMDNDALCQRVLEKIPPSQRAEVMRSFDTLVQAFLDCEIETTEAKRP